MHTQLLCRVGFLPQSRLPLADHLLLADSRTRTMAHMGGVGYKWTEEAAKWTEEAAEWTEEAAKWTEEAANRQSRLQMGGGG